MPSDAVAIDIPKGNNISSEPKKTDRDYLAENPEQKTASKEEPQTEPTIAELLKLPEHTIEYTKSSEEKLANVKEYVAKRRETQQYGFFDKSFGKENSERATNEIAEQQNTGLGLRERFYKQRLLWSMGRAKIADPEATLRFLEQHLPIISYRYLSGEALSNFIHQSSTADQEGTLHRIAQGFDRLTQLHLTPYPHDLSSPGFSDAFLAIADMPEEQFQRVYQEINQYTFLNEIYNLSDGGKLSDEASALIDVFKQGGLDPQQKDLLDKQQLFYQLTGRLPSMVNAPLQKYGKNFDYNMSLHRAVDIQSFFRMDDFLPYVVNFADWRIEASPSPDPERTPLSSTFLDRLEFMREQGALVLLDQLLERGWTPYHLYATMDASWISSNDGNIFDMVHRASQFAGDEEKVTWVRAVKQALTGEEQLDISEVEMLETMYEQKDTLQSLAILMKSIPSIEEDQPLTIVEVRYGKLEVHYDRLADRIQEIYNDNTFTGDKTLVNLMVRTLENIPGYKQNFYYRLRVSIEEDFLPLFAHIATQKGQHKMLGSGFEMSAVLLENATKNVVVPEGLLIAALKVTRDIENFSPAFLIQNIPHLNSMHVQPVVKNLTDQVVDTLPESDQAFVRFVKSLPEPLQYAFIENKNRFEEFVVDGKPTFSYFENAINEGKYGMIHEILSDEVIATFPQEQQEFYKRFKSLTPHARVVLVQHKAAFEQMFLDGKPTSAFLAELIKKQNLPIEEFNAVLAQADFDSFPLQDKQFWQTYTSVDPLSRHALAENRERFDEMFVDGKPTSEFLVQVALKSMDQNISEIMSKADLTTFSETDQKFWTYYTTSTNRNIRRYIAGRKGRFLDFVVDGKPTSAFLNEIADGHTRSFLHELLNQTDPTSFPPTERAFWEYYRNANTLFGNVLLNNKERFSEFMVDGKETPAFYQAFAHAEPQNFIAFATKDIWQMAFGEATQRLLDALPRRTDEKRNAFTHNEYDRTSQFILYLQQSRSPDFKLDAEHFVLLAPYVAQFGLTKNTLLFHYFTNLYRKEQGALAELPEDIVATGVTSVKELRSKLTALSKLIYSETPMTDLSGLSEFDKEMLEVVTGKASHRFDGGRRDLEQIIEDFQRDMAAGEIQVLPEGYKAETLSVSNIRIEFDATPIQGDFDILSMEILGAIENANDVTPLLSDLRNMCERKAAELEELIPTREGGKLAYMQKELTLMREYLEKFSDIPDTDQLLVTLLDMRFSDTNQQKIINSVFRRIVFGKVFQKNFSPGFTQEIQTQLEAGINAGSIETIINVVDEMAKTHALNLTDNNKDGYWSNEAYQSITKSKRGKDLPNSFSPHIGKLKEAVKQFEKISTGKGDVLIIPDRGFVGEMSGYLADVCYTNEYPLLKGWPNVIPYKFVRQNIETGEPEFIGSVLIFEVNDAEGNPSLLVRAFDVPDETAVDINAFIEGFLDNVATPVAKARRKKRILVPGNTGAISNYQMTINHMLQRYILGKEVVSLSDSFNFNGYDLTNNSYIAREIELQKAT